MIISGTIRNSVNQFMAINQWEQKKNDLGLNQKRQKQPLSEEEQLLQMFQEQADHIREQQKPNQIDAKLEAGAELTLEEIEYLRKHNPQALKEYEDTKREREHYKKQLHKCKTKEDVDKLRLNKMSEYLSMLKKASNNPNIPKSEKVAIAKRILKLSNVINEEHNKFKSSAEYAELPEEEEEKKKKRQEEESKEQERSGSKDVIPEMDELNEKLQEMLKEEGNTGDTQNNTETDDEMAADQKIAEQMVKKPVTATKQSESVTINITC